uniref:Putative LOV domain-containing protein n=1 Tax=Lunularia cruciata TaxID=56931 RepID=A0A126X2H9_9MARC|nr:putative LOV domain-containing protein [Lunularia cruciata]
MPDACGRSVDVMEQHLRFPLSKRDMPTKKGSSPGPLQQKKWMSPGPFQRTFGSNPQKPLPLPESKFSRDARGSLEIFGTSSQGSAPVFSSPAWHDALDAAENLFHGNETRSSRSGSLFGDDSEASCSEKGSSSLWRTKSRSQRLSMDKFLPRARAFSAGAKTTSSPVSITLEYGGSDHEFSLDADSDGELALPVPYAPAIRRVVPLTPRVPAVEVVYEPPQDIEEQWRALLDGSAIKAKREGSSVKDAEDDHWQGVLDGGVEEEEGVTKEHEEENMRRMSRTSSEYSDEVISERAAQWGYEVPMRASSELGDGLSTVSWRTSTRSSAGSRSSGGSSSSQSIPRVAKDVRDAITSFNLAFVVCDAAGPDPLYQVLYASGGFFKMTGYEADEVIGSNCRFLQGAATDTKEVAKIRKALKAGASYNGKILNYKKDGSTFWNVLAMSPIRNNDGEVIKYIGMQAEASEKKKNDRKEKKKVPAVEVKEVHMQAKATDKISQSFIPKLSLPPFKESLDTVPSVSYRYSLTQSRQSKDSVADWHALARLRAEIVSSARSADVLEPLKEQEKKKNITPRTKRVTRLFRKLNSKFSDSLRAPEIEYVDFEKPLSTLDESEFERRRRSSIYSRSSMDFRLDAPFELRSDVPERGERLSRSHCEAPSVTHGGRSQFVILH